MKTNQYIFLLVLFIGFTACGGEQKKGEKRIAPMPAVQKTVTKNDLLKMSLEGKVRSLEIKSFVVKEDGITERSVPGDNAERVTDMLYTFNEQGNILTETGYMGPERKEFSVKKYAYDEVGLLRRSELTTTDKTMHSLSEFFYDDKGLLKEKTNLLEQTLVDENGKKRFLRKSQKQLAKAYQGENATETELYENDTLCEKSTWKYNEKGNVQEILSNDVRNNKQLTIKTTYDARGNKTGTWFMNEADTVNSNTYVYNDKNDPEIVQLALSGRRWKFTYEYDEQGNWVVQNQYDETGKLIYRVRRKYTYY